MRSRKQKKPKNVPQAGGDSQKIFDPMSVVWMEKHDKLVSKIWNKVPKTLSKIIVAMAVFFVGVSIHGDWINLYVHFMRQLGFTTNSITNRSQANSLWTSITLENLRLTNFISYLIPACVVSYGIYFGVGGFLHWYYYVRRRDSAEEWKCQPTRWLSPQLERREILLGTLTLTLNSVMSAVLATYISNDGYCTVYYRIDEYGLWWFILQFPFIYIINDYVVYWIHRIYHYPFLYKHFHKLHHAYKQPTAFSVTAIHPVESLHIQFTLIAPLFVIPIHWLPYYSVVLYTYYHGIIDHSGINFKAQWWQPWQPDAIFHDNHHQYFHVNFGFNLSIWDKIHGTYRLKDRIYREDLFYGQGKSISEVSKEELQLDIKERESENPKAYRNNKVEFSLNKNDIKRIRVKK